MQKLTRKSKISYPISKKEISSENSINSSTSEEIIEVGKEKNLFCIDLTDDFLPKKKNSILNESSSYNSNQSKSKSNTKIQTKYKNILKNKKYENNIRKIKLKRKLFSNDNISEYEDEKEEEDDEDEIEKNLKKINQKKKIKIKNKKKINTKI